MRYLVAAFGLVLVTAGAAAGAGGVASPQLVSTDPYTGGGAQHRSEAEPSVAANGSTIVSAFQVGRFNQGGGSMNTGWATSTNGGSTWQHGTLPALTSASTPAGSYDREVDNTVAYDAAHHVWMISSIGIRRTSRGLINAALVVSRSPDGLNWSTPVVVSTAAQPDKDWLTCDDGSSSPGLGTCYLIWSVINSNLVMSISRTTDGGATWSAPVTTANAAGGYNTQIAVQPNGNVVAIATQRGNLVAFRSTDQGRSFSAPVVVAAIQHKDLVVHLRVEGAKPSMRVDDQGMLYAVWADCRFRAGCSSNDLVLSTSADGVSWSPVARIPIDAVTSGADHSLPGLGVDPATGGAGAHLGLSFYELRNAKCTYGCPLQTGFISSNDGGSTWLRPTLIGPTMNTTWLPQAGNEGFLGDYLSTAYVGAKPMTVVAIAKAPQGTTFDQSMYAAFPAQTPVGALVASVGPGRAVSLQPRAGTPGPYVITVHDRTSLAGFHLRGPGVKRSTGRAFRGTVTWRVTLRAGTYRFSSDAPGSRRGVLKIG